MKYAIVGLLAVLVAGVFVLAAVPMGSLGKVPSLVTGSDHQTPGPKHHGDDNETGDVDDDNETGEMEDHEANATAIAGGGGWQIVNMSGVLFKDTFGVFIGEIDNVTVGEFVFQARDQGVTIHSSNFTKVEVDNTSMVNVTIVSAWGWAIYDKSVGFWFNLMLFDGGHGSKDMLKLFIYKDADHNWTMDETSPLVMWTFESLGGGNIWTGPGMPESDE